MSSNSKSGIRKMALLGMPIGTASHRLRKSIMFALVKRCELDACHRCGERIDTEDELSIEHVVSWQLSDDPIRLFFDLENISFSHYVCNVSAGARPSKKFETDGHRSRFHSAKRNADPVRREKKNEWRRKRRATKKNST